MTARPVLFVTNHVPPDRAGAFAALHALEGIELALFGGRSHHGTAGLTDPGVPHRRVTQRDVYALAASGRFRAVVCGTAGRVALPAAWRGARRARVPFVLWSALWAQLSTPAHLVARPLMAWIYRDADAVVAYGPHVADFARAHGATNVHVAPQAVDNAFWSEPPSGAVAADATAMPFTCAFAGRAVAEKGLDVLLGAWERCGLRTEEAVLLLAGPGLEPATAQRDGVVALGALPPIELRNFYARADVLVIPSIATRSFREPWGLVANEAMNQLTAIIASDAVGAAAGGLVRHERNGLIVAAGDETPLAAAIRRLHDESELRRRMTVTGAADVGAYTYEAWAEGFAGALSTADDGRNPC